MTAKKPPSALLKVGRPTKLTPEVQAMLINLIKSGQPISNACLAVGISETTFYNWHKKAENGVPEFLEFFKSLKRAENECQAMHLANITAHSKRSWQASAWLLERRWPQAFGRPKDAPMTEGVNDGRRIMIEILDDTPDTPVDVESEEEEE